MKQRRHTVYLGLGSNKGGRLRNLARAVTLLRRIPSVTILAVSSLYETSPIGPRQRDYINAVIKIKTTSTPGVLLAAVKRIEKALGRSASPVRWGARTIDIDILLFDKEVLSTRRLSLPHPELEKRRFVLEPLAELAPRLRHPVSGVTMKRLRDSLSLTCPRQKVTMINTTITKTGTVRG